MNEWCVKHHGDSGLTQRVLDRYGLKWFSNLLYPRQSFYLSKLDLKVPAKIAVWFLETGRFLPVSIRVPWFLFTSRAGLDVPKLFFSFFLFFGG